MQQKVIVSPNISSFSGFFLLGFSSQPLLEMALFVFIVIFYLLTLLGNTDIIIWLISIPVSTPQWTSSLATYFPWISATPPVFTLLQILFNLKGSDKTITYSSCVGQLYVALAMCSTECILLAVMAVDCYLEVCWPLYYTMLLHTRVWLQLVTMTWLMGLTSSLVQMVLIMQVPLCGRNVTNHIFCVVPVFLKLACVASTFNQLELFLVSAFLLLVHLFLILISYSCIAKAMWKIRSSEGCQKVLGICSSHLAVVFLFYGTAAATCLQPASAASQDWDKFMALSYGIITLMLNPFIYTLQNKDMKGELREMILKES